MCTLTTLSLVRASGQALFNIWVSTVPIMSGNELCGNELIQARDQVHFLSNTSITSDMFLLIYISLATSFVSSQNSSQAGPLADVIPLPSQLGPQTPFTQPATKSGPLVMAYYPDWVSFEPKMIDFSLFDWIDFAFAVPNESFSLTLENPTALTRLVDVAHAHSRKVKLSVGGWTGSKFFSPAVATAASRNTFAKNLLATYKQFDLDGIDIDWEYPGHSGNPGNLYQGSDSENLLAFLRLLRSTLPSDAVITLAVQTTTFVNDKQQPMASLSPFVSLVDWVLIMNYDTWAGSSTPGPNAPLYDGCGNSTQQDASAVSAYNAWTSAGFPADKLVLGLPSYGYIYTTDEKNLRTRSHSREFRHSTGDGSFLKSDDGGTSGEISFRNLVQQGALVRSSFDNDSFEGSGGCVRQRDSCSATPYLQCPGQVVSYDDPLSISMKARLAKAAGLKGLNFWTATGDTDDWVLTRAARNA